MRFVSKNHVDLAMFGYFTFRSTKQLHPILTSPFCSLECLVFNSSTPLCGFSQLGKLIYGGPDSQQTSSVYHSKTSRSVTPLSYYSLLHNPTNFVSQQCRSLVTVINSFFPGHFSAFGAAKLLNCARNGWNFKIAVIHLARVRILRRGCEYFNYEYF